MPTGDEKKMGGKLKPKPPITGDVDEKKQVEEQTKMAGSKVARTGKGPSRGIVIRFIAGFVLAAVVALSLFHPLDDWRAWRDVLVGGASSASAVPDRVQAAKVARCPGYEASNVVETDSSLTADLRLAGPACNAFGDDIVDLKLLVEYQTDKRLHVKIYDAGLEAFQVQEAVLPSPAHNKVPPADAALRFSVVEKPFSFAVTRGDSGEELFNTSRTPLIFESQYLRVRTSLPDDPNLYGLGEHHDSFRLPTKGYRRTLWNADAAFMTPGLNSYGSHPVYFEHRDGSGQTHAVFLRNSGGIEVTVHSTPEDGQYLEYALLGGVLDFYFLGGPTPTEASVQYSEVVGLPAMHPYWSLGIHQCKYGYWDVHMLAEVVANYSAAGIPLDVLWSDIDSMDGRRDFTLDPERFPMYKMRLLIDTLHTRGQKFITMVDSAVPRVDYPPFQRGDALDVFLKADDGSNYLGVQWPGVVVWPDWLAPNTQHWWTDELVRWFDPATGMDVDGLWNDMNEAANFCRSVSCDPDKVAREGHNPPEPTHAPRPDAGRPIPGFPPEFQPAGVDAEKVLHAANASTPLVPDEPSVDAAGFHDRLHLHDQHAAVDQQELHREGSGSRSSVDGGGAGAKGQMKGLSGRDLLSPPYKIQNIRGPELSGFTIYTNITNYDGTAQYDTHNHWGSMMAAATRVALQARRPGKRPFVLTRSTFSGVGRTAAHWFGDNRSTWHHLRLSIAQMLTATALEQMPLVGSDVCGFNGPTNEQLCARWIMLGAFQPFFRNHADLDEPFQEPYVWEATTLAAKKATAARYRLLDYLYTALERQTRTGEPLAAPVWFAYPNDEEAARVEEQWLLGDAFLVSPVVQEDNLEVTAYFPDDIFYDFWTLEPFRGEGKRVTFREVGLIDIPVHVRGGHIIPLRAMGTANTTTQLRSEDFVLLVAPGLDGTAKGELYLDDGESLEPGDFVRHRYTWDGAALSVTAEKHGKPAATVKVESVVILGQRADPGIKGSTFDAKKGVVTVKGPWSLEESFGFSMPSSHVAGSTD